MPTLRSTYRIARFVLLVVLLGILAGVLYLRLPRTLHVERLTVPDGFSIEVFAAGVDGARSMVLGDRGTLFVGTLGPGAVYAARDTDGDRRADAIDTIATDLHMPNGVAFRDGALYVAEVGRVLRYDAIEDRLDDPPEPRTVIDGLPEETWHGWRYIAFGPE